MVEKPVTQDFFERNVEMAYKAGRAIIADETADRNNQYYTGMHTCSSQVNEMMGELEKKLLRLERNICQEGRDWSNKTEGLKEYFRTLHEDIVQGVKSELDEMKRTLDNLTTYSRSMTRIAKAPQARWSMSVDVMRTFKAVIDDMDESLKQNGIQCQVTPLTEPTIMDLNPFWLGRVLKGIMKDAIQRLLDGSSENRRMVLEFKVQKDHLKLSVSHNGLPFTDEEKESIFSISSAGHDAVQNMYFFANLVNKMGGKMEVEMEENSPESGIAIYLPLNLN